MKKMKRFIIYKKKPGTVPVPCEMFQYDTLPRAISAAGVLQRDTPTFEYVIFDNQSKHFIK